MFEHSLLIAFPSLQQQRAHDEEGESAAGAPQPHLGIGHAPTHQSQICPPGEALGLRIPPHRAAPQAATTRAADRHPAGRPMCQPGQPHHPHAPALAACRPLLSYLPGSPSPCPSATSLLVCISIAADSNTLIPLLSQPPDCGHHSSGMSLHAILHPAA